MTETKQVKANLKSPLITAVIVSYEPDADVLLKNISAVQQQVNHLVVVDNASSNQASVFEQIGTLYPDVLCTALAENTGLGYAHNQGIKAAKNNQADYVLLLDQDSKPRESMVESLLSMAQLKAQMSMRPISAIGPRYVGENRSDSFFIQYGLLKFKRLYKDASNGNLTPCDFLISSGAIDHVDTEWFLRAKSKGFQAYGSFDSIMEHSLGERTHAFRFLGIGRERNIPEHKPFRYYYMFRNSIALYKRSYVSKRWVWNDLQRLAQIFVFYGLCVGDRKASLKMMWLGVKHGFLYLSLIMRQVIIA